ncbi:uncharacterized protein N7487_001570 [Penicillium crustosum]|uniref:uncharacterized protein n=1 Tax=Penicillium crustosum TaxID=36656 RepID=UPI00239E7716|nr:uncharacterized protein N7487_001570 [Penicillium crustosum]KAJ5418020.1 hypothetical protein N7487_001570 [Penicillium crustosum]
MASLGLEYLESDPDSDPEIVPESPLATPITESRSPAAPITESPLAMPTLSFTFPLSADRSDIPYTRGRGRSYQFLRTSPWLCRHNTTFKVYTEGQGYQENCLPLL